MRNRFFILQVRRSVLLAIILLSLTTLGHAGVYTGTWNGFFYTGQSNGNDHRVRFTVNENDVVTSFHFYSKKTCTSSISRLKAATNIAISDDSFSYTFGNSDDEDFCSDGEGMTFSITFLSSVRFMLNYSFEECTQYCSNKSSGLTFGDFALPAVNSGTCVVPPYSQEFETPAPLPGWSFHSTNDGNIGVRSGQLIMEDFYRDAVPSLNEAILCLNLSSHENVILSFDHWSIMDKDDGLPEHFTSSFEGDGVSISDDGLNWYRVADSDILERQLATYRVNIDDEAVRIKQQFGQFDNTGIVYVKFQQVGLSPSFYPKYVTNADGRSWDDIAITGERVASTSGFWSTVLPSILMSGEKQTP